MLKYVFWKIHYSEMCIVEGMCVLLPVTPVRVQKPYHIVYLAIWEHVVKTQEMEL